jgi:hypothetical protein
LGSEKDETFGNDYGKKLNGRPTKGKTWEGAAPIPISEQKFPPLSQV